MNYFSIYSLSRGISQHICCRGLFLLSMHCMPLFRKKQEGFLLWWGIFQKSSTLITFPSVAIGMEKRQSIDPQSTGDQNEVGIGNFTHIFHKSDDAENQRGVSSSSPPPSVKINKITIKKFLVVTKAGFLIDSSERHKRRGEASCIKSENWFSIGCMGERTVSRGNGWRFVCIKMKIRGIVCNQS